MTVSTVRRPTEDAAIAAASRSGRPSPAVPAILADLISANRCGDREGVCLLAHRAVRAATLEVGE